MPPHSWQDMHQPKAKDKACYQPRQVNSLSHFFMEQTLNVCQEGILKLPRHFHLQPFSLLFTQYLWEQVKH